MLHCPKCKKDMSYLNFVSHFENDYEWNEEKKEYQPFAQCPNQGEHYFDCPECKTRLDTNGSSPDDDLQEELDDLDLREGVPEEPESFTCYKCKHVQEIRPNTFCDECGSSNA